VVDTMLHDSSDLVIYRTEIWAVWRPQVGPKNVWRFLTQQFDCCTCTARSALCPYTVLLEHKIVTRHSAYRWQQYDVIMTSEAASKKIVRDITRISCFVTIMKLLHALQIYSAVFVKQCAQLHFSR